MGMWRMHHSGTLRGGVYSGPPRLNYIPETSSSMQSLESRRRQLFLRCKYSPFSSRGWAKAVANDVEYDVNNPQEVNGSGGVEEVDYVIIGSGIGGISCNVQMCHPFTFLPCLLLDLCGCISCFFETYTETLPLAPCPSQDSSRVIVIACRRVHT